MNRASSVCHASGLDDDLDVLGSAARAVPASYGAKRRCGHSRDAAELGVIFASAAGSAASQSLRLAVARARAAGLSWSDLGKILGTSRQAAQQRFS